MRIKIEDNFKKIIIAKDDLKEKLNAISIPSNIYKRKKIELVPAEKVLRAMGKAEPNAKSKRIKQVFEKRLTEFLKNTDTINRTKLLKEAKLYQKNNPSADELESMLKVLKDILKITKRDLKSKQMIIPLEQGMNSYIKGAFLFSFDKAEEFLIKDRHLEYKGNDKEIMAKFSGILKRIFHSEGIKLSLEEEKNLENAKIELVMPGKNTIISAKDFLWFKYNEKTGEFERKYRPANLIGNPLGFKLHEMMPELELKLVLEKVKKIKKEVNKKRDINFNLGM